MTLYFFTCPPSEYYRWQWRMKMAKKAIDNRIYL